MSDLGVALQYKQDPTRSIWKLFQTSEAKAKLKQKYESRFNNILPHISSGDPRFHGFLRDLVEDLAAELPPSVKEGMVYGNCMIGGYDRFRALSGVKSRPVGHVLHSNARLRDELGLCSGFRSDRDRMIWHGLIDLMMEDAIYANVPIAKKSTQGLFTFTYDTESKVRDVRTLLSGSVCDRYMRAYVDGDASSAINIGKFPLAYSINYRLQDESPDKERLVADFDYACSGGTEGRMIVSDKTAYGRDGVIIDGLGACRVRLVFGLSNPPNMIMNCFTTGIGNYYLERYAFTWKHRGADDIAAKINSYAARYDGLSLLGIDVTNFDRTVGQFLFDDLFEYISGRYVSEVFAKYCALSLRAAVFQPESGDDLGPVFHGDPLDVANFLEAPGLLSGNAWVAFIGKLVNVFNLLCVLDSVYGDLLEHMKEFLQGDYKVACLNQGDDGVLLCPSSDSARTIARAMRESGWYLKIDVEQNISFLGFVLTKDTNGQIKVINKLESFVSKTFIPERGYDSKLREFWHLGLSDRYLLYGNHPSFSRLLDIIDRCWLKRFPQFGSFTNYSEYLIESHRWHNPVSTTEMESELLRDPSVALWKYSLSDFRQETVDQVLAYITPEDYRDLVESHFLVGSISEQKYVSE